MSSKKYTLRQKIAAGFAAVAAVVAVGFGASGVSANWTDTDDAQVEISTGDLTVTLTGVGDSTDANLSFTGIGPGGSKTDAFVIKNTGTVPATASMDVNVPVPPNAASMPMGQRDKLTVKVNGAAPVSVMAFAGSLPIDLGTLAPGQSRQVNITVALDAAADNSWKNISASGGYTVTLTS